MANSFFAWDEHLSYRRRMDDASQKLSEVLFAARLKPHRSLSSRGFRWIMAGVIAVSLIVGTGLYFAGAWPVFGFLGLDVLAIYVALRASYRSARIAEIVELTERELIVERRDSRGARRRTFQPAWLRVELARPVLPSTPLLLRSHGESLAIGAFLSPAERQSLASDLTRALDNWRRRS
jgi:uncharacterized membrane protein